MNTTFQQQQQLQMNCTEADDVFDNCPPPHNFLLISFQFVLICIFLCLQLITLPILFRHAEFWSQICYRIMFAIGLCDVILLCIDVIGIIFGVFWLQNSFILKIMSALDGPTFDMLFLLELVLAINRLICIIKTIKSPATAHFQPRWERYGINALLFASAVYYSSIFVAYLTPYCCTYYDERDFFWKFNSSLPWSSKLIQVESNVQFYSPLIIFALYIVIFALMQILNAKWSVQQSTADKQILLQSLIMFVLLTGSSYGFIFGNVIRQLFSPSGQYYLFYTEYIIGDVVFGINPLLYVALNPRFRYYVLKILKKNNGPNQPSANLITNMPDARTIYIQRFPVKPIKIP